MILSIHIKNYALIEDALIDLSSGFNVITGETGAGKSLFLSAIAVMRGQKVDTKLINNKEKETSILMEIDPKKFPELRSYIKEHDLDQDTFIVKRTFSKEQNRCFINDQPVGLPLLKKLMANLLYVCSQHDNTQVSDSSEQRLILDSFIKNPYLDELKEIWNQRKDLINQQNELKDLSKRVDQNLDYVQYQLSEIKESGISQEDLSIDEKLLELKNQESLNDIMKSLNPLLYDEHSVKNQLRLLNHYLEQLSKIGVSVDKDAFDDAREKMINFIDTIKIKQSDENEIEYWINRSNSLSKIIRKHGKTVQDVISKQEQLEHQLEKIQNSEQLIESLEKKISALTKKGIEVSKKISKLRQKGLIELESKITTELQDLNMKGSQFKIQLVPDQELSIVGSDLIEFLIKPHSGQIPLPLAQIASGGEMSRVLLAVNSVIETKGCFLFDEIDAGIGGNTGIKIGEKLKRMAKKNQIICITHLHQVAVYAETQFKIEKTQSKTRTITQIFELKNDARASEISRMLGDDLSSKTIDHARELLKNAQR